MPDCEICGEPMPEGESMFKFHGFSGPCPKPPLPKRTAYYELKPVEERASQPGAFLTAAVRSCGLCGETIEGMGGPGPGSVCVRCAEVVMRGEARGAIKWDVTS